MTTWRLYSHYARAGFMSYLAHPITVVLILLIIILQATVFGTLWQSVATSHPIGFQGGEMLTYITLGFGLRSYYSNFLDRELGESIRSGAIVSDLALPADVVYGKVAVVYGRACVRFLTTTLPYILVMAWLFPLSAPASLPHAGLTLLSALASLAVICGVNLFVGTTAFATEHYNGLASARAFVLNTLSGLYIPYVMLPDRFRTVLDWLPFSSLADLPATLYLGKLSVSEGLLRVGVAWVWAIALLAGGRAFFEWMRRRHPVDGG